MSTSIKKRKRARKACTPCHQRKRKCDGAYPCQQCTDFEYTCQYGDDENHSSTGHHASTFAQATSPGSAGRNDIHGILTNGVPSVPIAASPARSSAFPNRSAGGARRDARNDSTAVGTGSITTSTPTATSTPAGSGINGSNSGPAGSSAAMTFPHALGVALGSDSPPKVHHSVAYNFGIRPEEASQVHASLGQLVSEEELREYSEAYFAALTPMRDLVDKTVYARRCREYYSQPGSAATSTIFAAIAAGLAALGSFLSLNRHPREAELVQYAKAILEDPASMRSLSVDLIVAYGLRVFYLRATSRPSIAWIASCTTMHLCEALGLHEEEKMRKLAAGVGAAALGHGQDRLQRIFWVTWAGHALLSYEYDRSSVQFRDITIPNVPPCETSIVQQFVQIAHIIPTPNSPFRLAHQPPTQQEELCERLKALAALPLADPFLVLTKADLAFCFYRRIYQLKMGVSDETIRLVIQCGNAAIDAAAQLADQGRLFWNVIGSVFQYVCVLLALDTPAATAHVSSALTGLENLVKAADTPLTREAWAIAQHLLGLSLARKRKELTELEPFEARAPSSPAQLDLDTTLPDLGWDWDWDQFLLEPYLSIFDRDV